MRFVPDRPGKYEVQVIAELVWEDSVTGEPDTKAETYAVIEASGDPVDSSGCSVTAVGARSARAAWIPFLLLLIGLGVRRTR